MQQHSKPMEFRQPEQIVHTPMGSAMKPAEFQIGNFVKVNNLPGVWVVLQILGDSKYIIGSEGNTQKVQASDLTITDEEV